MADLSPAAQSVLDAVIKAAFSPDAEAIAAAALRALADHRSPFWTGADVASHWHPDERTRQELRNIADELQDCV